jgi:hypothetical protein
MQNFLQWRQPIEFLESSGFSLSFAPFEAIIRIAATGGFGIDLRRRHRVEYPIKRLGDPGRG